VTRKDQNHHQLQYQVRTWIEENKPLANIMAAWLLFVFEMVIAKLIGDFDTIPVDFRGFAEKYPGAHVAVIGLPLALMSIANIYGVPAVARWFASSKRNSVTRLLFFGGVFGSFFCCPVFAVALGITFMIFTWVLIIHTFIRLNKTL
jgi:hypothetical protein